MATRQHNTRAVGLLIGSLALIGALTLAPAPQPKAEGMVLCIICGDFGTTSFLLNVLLFVPLGASLHLGGIRLSRTLLLAAVVTAGIELAQHFFLAGRYGNLGDALANTSGAGLGWLIPSRAPLLLRPPAALARRLAIAASAAILGGFTLGAWALRRDTVNGPLYGQLSPDMGDRTPFRGEVLAAEAAGFPIERERLSERASQEIIRALEQDALKVRASLLFHGGQAGTGHIIRIMTGGRVEVAALSRSGSDARFSSALQARRLRLRSPQLTLPDAFMCDTACAGGSPNPLVLSGVKNRNTMLLIAESGGKRRVVSTRLSPSMTWALFAPAGFSLGSLSFLLTAVWLCVQMGVLGLWLSQWRGAAPKRNPLILGAIAIGAGMVGIPVLFGFSVAQWWEWLAAASGLVLGLLIARSDRAAGRVK